MADVVVYVEVPSGSRNQYERDPDGTSTKTTTYSDME